MESAIRELQVDRLLIRVYRDRAALGRAAAERVARELRALLSEQAWVGVVFAAAASQIEFLTELGREGGIDWSRVAAFHMDEYVGPGRDDPASLGRWLRERFFERVHPGRVHYLDGTAPRPEDEGRRYARLLAETPPRMVCLGIGVNGHLAFNEPHQADLADPEDVRVVEMDRVSRLQQVEEGAFPSIDRVPRTALTLTVPALLRTPFVSCVVPGPGKAQAVKSALRDPISAACPASALRTHGKAVLHLDEDSAREIDTEIARR